VAALTVTLSAAADGSVSIDYSILNGSVVAGEDYQTATGTLVFAPGEINKQVTLSVSGD